MIILLFQPTPLSSKHLGHFVVSLLGRRARPLAKLTEKKLSNFLIGEFERKKLLCYYRIEGGRPGFRGGSGGGGGGRAGGCGGGRQ